MVELAAKPETSQRGRHPVHMNRLSDFLFVASRFQNNKGAADVLWVPARIGKCAMKEGADFWLSRVDRRWRDL